MRSILKYTVFAVLCGLFMMQSVATAQDKSATPVPAEKTDKSEKADKSKKPDADKPSKTSEGLAPLSLKDFESNFQTLTAGKKTIFKNIRPKNSATASITNPEKAAK